MTENPISPIEAVRYYINPYSNDKYDRDRILENHISKINQTIGKEISIGDIGKEAKVRYVFSGFLTQGMLLELVVIYRQAGWTVTYGYQDNLYIEFLIKQ